MKTIGSFILCTGMLVSCSQYDPNLFPPWHIKTSSKKDSIEKSVGSREFEKIAEAQFIGKWQGNFLSKNGTMISVDVEVNRSDEESFLCQLRVGSGRIRLYNTTYLMGRGVLEGEGLTMSPVHSGFAEMQVRGNPEVPDGLTIRLSLTKSY